MRDLQEQLQNGFIKLYGDDNIKYGHQKKINFLLKISGIWENEKEYGITYKFIPIEN